METQFYGVVLCVTTGSLSYDIFKSMYFIIRDVHTISVIWNTATLISCNKYNRESVYKVNTQSH